jgi:hypothetical protein
VRLEVRAGAVLATAYTALSTDCQSVCIKVFAEVVEHTVIIINCIFLMYLIGISTTSYHKQLKDYLSCDLISLSDAGASGQRLLFPIVPVIGCFVNICTP